MKTETKSEFFPTGTLKNRGEYILGTNIKHGSWIEYFGNGRIAEEGNYKNGKREGEWVLYLETGGMKGIKVYKDGKPVENYKAESEKQEEVINEADNM